MDVPMVYPIVVVGLALIVVSFAPSLGLALLLSISLLKSTLRRQFPALMESYTYDVAIVCLAFAGVLIHRLRRGGGGWNVPWGCFACWIVLALLMVFRLPASRDLEVGYRKVLIFGIFNTLACLTAAVYVTSYQDVRRLTQILVLLGVVAVGGMLAFGTATHEYVGARMSFGHAHVFGVADACVHAALVLLAVWLARRQLRFLLVLVAFLPGLIYTITASGTRAALLFPPVIMLAVFWVYRRRLNFAAVLGGAAAAVAIGYIAAAVLSPELLTRFTPEAIRDGFEARLYMVRQTWAGFLHNPFLGNGTGDTSFQFGKPHNHLLEVANELGLFGLAAYLGLMAYGLRAGLRLCSTRLDGTDAKNVAVPIFACLGYQVLLSFKMGSYAAVYTEYFFLTVLVVLDQLRRREQRLMTVPATDALDFGGWRFPEQPALGYGPPSPPSG